MAQMKYFYELTISSSPHAHSPVTTQTIMRDVLIAYTAAHYKPEPRKKVRRNDPFREGAFRRESSSGPGESRG